MLILQTFRGRRGPEAARALVSEARRAAGTSGTVHLLGFYRAVADDRLVLLLETREYGAYLAWLRLCRGPVGTPDRQEIFLAAEEPSPAPASASGCEGNVCVLPDDGAA